jgi:putative ABC transport system ATP-binding protein
MRRVNKSYGLGEARVHVLRDIDFTVQPGEFVAVLGPSGSGKSTLMNLIGLIDTPDDGQYLLSGRSIPDRAEEELAALRNEHIGFVFQKFNLIGKYSAEMNTALPLLLRGYTHRDALRRAQAVLGALGLGDRLRHRPNQLSGGQQQRVAIARALVGGPDIILADEPTGALDRQTGREVMELLAALNARGKTIIVITHDENVAAYAHRVVRIEDGRIADATNS